MEIHGYTQSGAIDATIDGDRMTVPDDLSNRHRQMIAEWEAEGNTIPPYVPPAPVALPVTLSIFAAGAVCIADGSVNAVELAAELQGAYYEDGWLVVGFSQPQDESAYLIFAQADVPARIEQFKDRGSFELIFTDPATGDSVEPGRVDLQILKVR